MSNISVDEIFARIQKEADGEYNRSCAQANNQGCTLTPEELLKHFLDNGGERYVVREVFKIPPPSVQSTQTETQVAA